MPEKDHIFRNIIIRDDCRVPELALQIRDLPLDGPILLFGKVVLGILREIPHRGRLANPLLNIHLQLVELFAFSF